MYQQHMILKLRKPVFKFTLNKYHASFKLLKLSISITIPVTNCLYLHGSYITKFDFMNYAVAKLVVAWLYLIYLHFGGGSVGGLACNIH